MVFSSIALGAQEQGADLESSALPTPTSAEDLKALTEGSEVLSTEPHTDPAAAEELPHTDLGRAEAEDLLTSVFLSALDEQAGIYGDLEVEAFRSDHVAVVPPEQPEGQPGLLSSLLPLRVENEDGEKEVVNFDLEDEGAAGLSPSNPLVAVQIPASLSQAIDMPEVGISIGIADVADREASTISDAAAFYPNVAGDADISILPTPTGVETLTQLRSPAAPTTQRFELDLPAGAALRETEDGGAIVEAAGGQPLLVARPPSAVDANGDPVEVSMETVGSSILLTATPRGDAAYPILVDPVFESYSWMNNNNTTGIYSDWRSYTSNSNVFKPGWIGTIGGQMRSGLALRSSAGATAPGTSMSWNYYVPRYFTDKETQGVNQPPTTYIKTMTLSQVYFVLEDSPVHSHPYLMAGLWDENKGEFTSYLQHGGWEGAYNGVTLPTLSSSGEYRDIKNGGFALATYESTSYPRQGFVGNATVEVADDDAPKWGLNLGNVPEWVSTQEGTAIAYEVSDYGLGIHDLRIKYAAARGGKGEGMITVGCSGAASSPCPRTSTQVTKRLLYDPGAIAQGENWVNIYAVDPIGHWSPAFETKIKIDREQPELGTSGALTEQKTLGTKLAQYVLKLDVKDGDEASPTAVAPIGTAGTGTGQLERPFGVATDPEGNVWVADTTNNRLVKYDKNGTYVRQITERPGEGPFSGLRGITVTPDGSLWVAESSGRRVDQFNPFTGLVMSTISTPSYEPFDLAFAPDGMLWVTDPNNKKVYKYTAGGSLSQTISIPQPSSGVALPFGIDLDEYGNAWVAIQGTNKIMELSSSGSVLFSFGTEGTEPGQFKNPQDVAVAPSGNILTSDGIRNRVQVFKPDGSFLRQYASTGTLNSQVSEPRGIEILPGNKLLVADAGNHRIVRWEHADLHVESGAVKTEVKVDGATADTYNPGCAEGKNCSLAREWVMKADNYSVGSHKVDVIATDGVGLKTEKTLTVETHGDLQAPAVALSGTMTEQATLGNTRPTYKLKVSATDSGSAEERKSGVASTSIKVDGVTVDSSSPGCPSSGCSITREWTLDSSSKPAGTHTVEVKATDAAGRSTTKTLSIKIERDTTAPQLVLSGALPGAPEGWVQEGTRSATADATDEGGYGVKQIRFLIDGVLVGESLAQTCEAGGCPKSKTFWIDMTPYSGGAHEAVMVGEDLAGNIRKKTWTINLDPEGHISASEAADTLEAVEATSDDVILYPSSAVDSVLPFEPPGLDKVEGVFQSTGAPLVTTTPTAPGAATTLETAEGPMVIEPLSVSSGASEGVLQNDAAAVSSNTSSAGVDTVTHPLFDGTMMFQAIRDASAPQSFSWRFNLNPEMEIEEVNDQTLQVWWKGEPRHPAVNISVTPAHDAIGSTVPTTLELSAANVVTLIVHHQDTSANGGAPFVYPVVAGTGWKGGFETMFLEAPSGEIAPEEEGGLVSEYYESAPEPASVAEAEVSDIGEPLLARSKDDIEHKHFRWIQCERVADVAGDAPKLRPGGKCGNPFAGEEGSDEMAFSYGIRGDYYRVLGVWAKHRGSSTEHIECAKKNMVDHWDLGAAIEGDYFVDPARKCVWWGPTKDGGGKFVEHGKHLSPYGEWNWGYGSKANHIWYIHQSGLALYIWVTDSGHVGHHNTTCIDC
ncbi:MAG TPA: hypothetical protein VNC16_03510 [Solirubrobacterales bacterium]|nr:hypothetical protein [Solirubrobacterales bacterium]